MKLYWSKQPAEREVEVRPSVQNKNEVIFRTQLNGKYKIIHFRKTGYRRERGRSS